MFVKHGQLMRACAVVIALQFMAAPLFATPSDCADTATGSQTGNSYSKVGQSTRTVTTVVELQAGVCGVSGSASQTTTETYNVGYYRNQTTGQIAIVNCSTGQILGWL
jgi:hypothetical protein